MSAHSRDAVAHLATILVRRTGTAGNAASLVARLAAEARPFSGGATFGLSAGRAAD
ncbi:protein of unknown function [Burkholderia multivorans]